MPVAVNYPGVYIEEIPSGVRTITGWLRRLLPSLVALRVPV